MKRIATVLACVAALALPAASLAGDGKGGAGFDEHYARASAHVEKFVKKCRVATPPAKCAEVKTRLGARLAAWEARISERIAKVSAHPQSEKRDARLAELKSRLAKVTALAAQL